MFGLRCSGGIVLRLVSAVIVCAVTSFAATLHGETVSATLMLSEEVGKNELEATLEVDEPECSPDIAIVTGSLEISLIMEFDPVTHEPTAITGLSFTGGHWSVNDLYFNLVDTGERYGRGIGIGGTLGSDQISVVHDGAFPASDHFLVVNQGKSQIWVQEEEEDGSWEDLQDYSQYPNNCALEPGSGTIHVSLASLDGNTATYNVAGTMPIVGVFPTGWFAQVRLDGMLDFEAEGSFVRVVPEPTSLSLFMSALVGLLALWGTRRRLVSR